MSIGCGMRWSSRLHRLQVHRSVSRKVRLQRNLPAQETFGCLHLPSRNRWWCAHFLPSIEELSNRQIQSLVREATGFQCHNRLRFFSISLHLSNENFLSFLRNHSLLQETVSSPGKKPYFCLSQKTISEELRNKILSKKKIFLLSIDFYLYVHFHFCCIKHSFLVS